MTLFKLTGLTIGIGFIFLAAWWRDDPAAGATLLFFAGTLLILGSRHTIVNEEAPEWEKENQK